MLHFTNYRYMKNADKLKLELITFNNSSYAGFDGFTKLYKKCAK